MGVAVGRERKGEWVALAQNLPYRILGANQYCWAGGIMTHVESALCDTQVVGRYGTQRVSARDNEPSSRIGAATWLDPGTGLLYLFGGHCIDKELQISMHSREWAPLAVLRRRCESEAHLAYIVRETTGVLAYCWA
jgi:hypothetical protein